MPKKLVTVFQEAAFTSLYLKSYLPVTETASQDKVADVKPILDDVTLVGSGIVVTVTPTVSE